MSRCPSSQFLVSVDVKNFTRSDGINYEAEVLNVTGVCPYSCLSCPSCKSHLSVQYYVICYLFFSTLHNPLSTKMYLSDLKTQFVPRRKHSLSRL